MHVRASLSVCVCLCAGSCGMQHLWSIQTLVMFLWPKGSNDTRLRTMTTTRNKGNGAEWVKDRERVRKREREHEMKRKLIINSITVWAKLTDSTNFDKPNANVKRCLPISCISIYIHLYLSVYLFSEYYYLPSPGPAVDDVVAHCLPTRWRTIVNNRIAAAAVIRMLRRAACNVRHRRSGPGEGRGIGGGTRNHFKIRNSCCLFEKLLAPRTQQKETREQKGKTKRRMTRTFPCCICFSPQSKTWKMHCKKIC